MSTISELARTGAKLLLGKGTYRTYGQNGEDAMIRALLRGIKKGTYVDVGAFHPVQYSNTYGLYKDGWTGMTIDPNPMVMPLHKALRPRDIFVSGGVASKEAELDYYMFSDGAYNTFDKETAEEQKKHSYPKFVSKSTRPVYPLHALLKKHNITHVDFMDVDVEGLDVAVLETFDWSMKPKVIAIESRTFNPEHMTDDAAYNFLKEKGYVLAGFLKYTLVFIYKGWAA